MPSTGMIQQLLVAAPRATVATNVPDLSNFVVAVLASSGGVTFVAGDQVLLTGQTTVSQNGIYVVGTVGAGLAPLTVFVAGELETVFEGGRPTSCLVDLYAGMEDPTDDSIPLQKLSRVVATVDPVNTTTTGVVDQGDTIVPLTSVTGIVAGRRYMIGVADGTEPFEDVVVRMVDGTSVILWGELAYRHASGVAFVGLRCAVTVGTSAIPVGAAAPNAGADVVWGSGYAVWTPVGGTLDAQTEVVDCVRFKIPRVLCGLADLREVRADWIEMLDPDTDIPGGLKKARDTFLMLLGRHRIRYTVGAAEFTRGVALTFFLLRRHNFGDKWAKEMVAMDAERKEILGELRAYQPADKSGNGIPDEADASDGSGSDFLGMSATDCDFFPSRNPMAGVFVGAPPDDD